MRNKLSKEISDKLSEEMSEKYYCQFCGSQVLPTTTTCPSCRTKIIPQKKVKKKVKTSTIFTKRNITLPTVEVSPTYILMKKSFFFDICTKKKFVLSILIMVLVPVIFLLMIDQSVFSFYPTLNGILGLIVFYYTYGFIFPLIIGVSAAPLISEELKSGTLLTLISHPISRSRIVLAKFIALIIFGILLSLISLIIIILFALIRNIFPDFLEFFTINFIYSVVLLLFFGGLSLGLSPIFKKPRNAIVLPIVIILFSIGVGVLIKSMTAMSMMYEDPSFYEQYQLYHFDISYHMANFYMFLVDTMIPGLVDSWGQFMVFFGVFKYKPSLQCTYYGRCSIRSVPIRSNFYSPLASILVLVFVFGFLLLIGGMIYFRRREIV